MSEALAQAYEQEIRDFLFARVGKQPSKGPIKALQGTLPTSRILSWWIFEGRSYRGLKGRLAENWDLVDRQARRLRSTYNPRWRAVQAPEGEVDWVATALLSVTSNTREVVCRATRIGLSDEEEAALEGWLSWISNRWEDYVSSVGAPADCTPALPWAVAASGSISIRQLRRWAHTAKRSRWPLLRNVVAESLRCLFEPQLIDSIPLPSKHSDLFEIVCAVRVLRSLRPDSVNIRWLDLEASKNVIEVDGVKCHYQRSFSKETMLGTEEFSGALQQAVDRYELRVPKFADALFMLSEPIGPFEGILLEAKSGAQRYEAAIYQLKCYLAALKKEGLGPLLVWGVTEQDPDPAASTEALGKALEQEDHRENLWIFSAASSIPHVLSKLTARTNLRAA